MPLSDALLTPIEGENPSGANLYREKIFSQIQEAWTEEVDDGTAGQWSRTLKRADHPQVIKLATEAVSKRTKDLRLLGFLIDSTMKREGLSVLLPALDLMQKFQEEFWPTFYPEIDEDGDLGLRVGAVESVVNRTAVLLRTLPLTSAKHNALQYRESRLLGPEEAADNSDKRAARQDAIDHGAITPEEFDIGVKATDDAALLGLKKLFVAAGEKLEEIKVLHEEKYGDDYPSMTRLSTSVEEVGQVISELLYAKGVKETEAEPESEDHDTPLYEPEADDYSASSEPVAATQVAAPSRGKAASFSGVPTSEAQAQAAILAGATFLQTEAMASPVPYLVCAGIRFGETRLAGAYPSSDFGVAPPTETRQALRKLANEGNWDELLTTGLKTLAEPCARTWLDLHRFLWRAASSNGYEALAIAIISTVRGILHDLPDMRTWTLDDDTPVGNAETQQWLDAEVVPPPPEPVAETPVYEEAQPEPEPVYAPPTSAATNNADGPQKPELYDEALALLKAKRPGEAIQMLVRDAELQPSGRSKFQRRVQVAQLCLAANQGTIAYPILQQLSREAEQRNLETWETGKMLAQPLALLLRCLDRRGSSEEEKELLFERLCRLDPEAALEIRS